VTDTLLVYALARCEGRRGLLPRLLRRWREEQGRALAELFERPLEELRAHLFPAERAAVAEARARLDETRELLDALAAEGICALSMFDEGYPHTLDENMARGALPLLFLKGDASILRRPGMAVIGSRTVTEPAREYARRIAGRLAERGCDIVSGYAMGIDQAAFEGAVASGQTTVVLPQGIRTFLAERQEAARWIEAGKLLALSQFLPDAPWAGQQAMARNVTIAALADVLIVVAAGAARGGTEQGAELALRRGRPVFVRRPLPDDRSCPGSLRLIGQGAFPLPHDAEDAWPEILIKYGSACRR
jgi:DNA processing protein